MTDPALISLAKSTALARSLDPTLVCAVIEQESAWNTWAIRYEPAFFRNYVADQFTNNKINATEAYARAFSWGLLQTMGLSVRELGFEGPLASLCEPSIGLEWGCRLLSKKLAPHLGDVRAGLLAYNGGSAPGYADQVLGRIGKYR